MSSLPEDGYGRTSGAAEGAGASSVEVVPNGAPAARSESPGGGNPVDVRAVSPVDMGLLAATRLAKMAGNYPCAIRIGHASDWAEAGDILGLLSLGAAAGAVLVIEARGDHAREAAGTIAWMVADSYGIKTLQAGEAECADGTCAGPPPPAL